ncbi:MAG TPA: hypothetical protein VNW28_10580 [Chthoniobacterales bacterium]|nr:hypothetical protein [Chthoniobacterales bacterium]
MDLSYSLENEASAAKEFGAARKILFDPVVIAPFSKNWPTNNTSALGRGDEIAL